jgi:hypothetical protein
MPELTPSQIAILRQLSDAGFTFAAFPMYANYIGIKRENCAALLAPVESGGFRLFGEPGWLVGGQISVRVRRNGRDDFVWKKEFVEATPERLAELGKFTAELSLALQERAGPAGAGI